MANSPTFAGLLSLLKVLSMSLSKGRFTLGFWALQGADQNQLGQRPVVNVPSPVQHEVERDSQSSLPDSCH